MKLLSIEIDEKVKSAVSTLLAGHQLTETEFINTLYLHIMEFGIPYNLLKHEPREVSNILPRPTFKTHQELLDYCEIFEKPKKSKKKSKKKSASPDALPDGQESS